MVVAIKFQFGDEIRRISVSDECSWDELVVTAKNMFPQLDGFVLQYKDDEGSVITVRSEMEYQEAKRVAHTKGSSVFFTVSVPKQPFQGCGRNSARAGRFGHFKKYACPAFNSLDQAEEQEQVHRFITCDGCQQYPLRGTRYHCLQCHDFDLCGDCHQKAVEGTQFQSHTADHAVAQITKPTFPRGRWARWAQHDAASQCEKQTETATAVPVEKKEEVVTTTNETPEPVVVPTPEPVTVPTSEPAPVAVPEEKEKEKEEEKVVVAVVEKTDEEKKAEEALKVLREMGLPTEDETLIELLKTNNYDAATVIDLYFN